MRNLISFAVACLVLLPATGVRAEVFPVGDDGGRGASVGEEGGPEKRVEKPMVTITAIRTAELDAKLEIHIDFDQDVTGLELTEIGVTNAITVSDLMGEDQNYDFVIRTNTDFVGSITITVPEGAAENGDDEGNEAMTFTFAVDNKAPALERATASRDTITLEYDETLDEDHVPDDFSFTVHVWGADGEARSDLEPRDARVRGDRVFVLLQVEDSILAGDSVAIDYLPPSDDDDRLQDARGNKAPELDGESVMNLRMLDRPGAVQDLTATGVNTDTINIDWDPPADDGGSAIIGYRIRASNDGGISYSVLRSNTASDPDTVSEYVHDGLEPDETWHYLVSAINGVGEGTITGTSGTTKREGEVPGDPTELTAEPDGNTAIDLDWDAPTNTGTSAISGYRIEVSTDGGNIWTDLVTNTADTNTFYKHTGLEPDTERHYQVRAINDTGESAPSNVADATTTTTTSAPDPPTGLTATAQGEDQIDLSWTAPSNDGGSPITGYRIEMSDDGTTGWTDLEANTGLTATTYSDNTLTAGTTRHYRVSAINALGTGNPSNVDDATTEGTLPGRPTGLTATAQDTSQIDLAWTAPTDDGGTAITGYRIERSDDGTTGSWIDLVANTGSTGTTHTDSRLRRGTTRYYRVSAINAVGDGDPSNVDSATTLDVPGSPTGLTATARDTSQIDLAWTAPTNDGGTAITGYRIEASENGGATWTVLVENSQSTATTYPDESESLTAGTTWHYRVSAINAIGTGSASNVAHATTDATVPDAPTNLTATASGRTRIDLDWDPPSFNGGSDITGYRIEISADAGVTWSDLVSNTGRAATSYAHTGLSAATTRHYRVSAINALGTGNPSNVDDATTEGTLPGRPTGLTATAQDTSQIDLAWTAPTDDGGTAITGYRIERSDDGTTGSWIDLVANTGSTGTTHTDSRLRRGTTRYYRVSAINAVGDGDPSNVDSATTLDVPGSPTGLTATARDTSQIDLAWTAPTNDGGTAITGYRIEASENGGATWTVLVENSQSTATTYPDESESLTAGTTWHYRVSAINAIGTGSASNVAHATTDATVPDAPTNLTATASGRTRIDLDWDPPSFNGGSDITGYRIEISADAGVTWSDLVSNTGRAATSYAHTGLSAATTRHYRVSAINALGTGNPSNVDDATTEGTLPGRPTGLTATAQDTSQIDLAWTAPTDDGGTAITGYRIERSDDGTTGSWIDLVANTGSTGTTHTDSRLRRGTTRYYRVSAINAVGDGDPSNVDSATTLDVPGSPTGLTATARDTSQIDLAWTAPTNDGGTAITGYRIEASENGGATWTVLVENSQSTATTYPDESESLTAGTTWHYRVSAINAIGTGSASNVAHATTDATVPDAPTNLTATASGRTRIDLDWDPPSFNGGSDITGYRIEISADAGVTWSDLVSNTGRAATSYAHTGLSAATTRHYRVRALNEKGAGAASNVDSATTASGVPDAPTGLNAVAAGTSRIDLSWSAPADDNGSAVTGYRIEVSNTGNSGWSVLDANTSSPTTTDYSHTGLTPDTTLYYRVSAINAVGTGPPSNVDHATTDPTIPGPPTNLTATADGRTRINLSWSPPADDGGSPVTGYHIEFSADGGTDWEDLSRNTGSVATFFVHAGLAPGTTRHYRVSAINVAGTGMSSNVDDATTDATVPGAPTGLDAMANGSSRIDLSWTAPTYDGGSSVTGYRIQMSTDAGVTWSDRDANTGSTSTRYAHTGLSAATTRHYRVRALNEKGAGAASNVDSATTASGVPDAPTGLNAVAAGTSRIDLSWSAPADDNGSAVTGYRIEVSNTGNSGWSVHEANTNSTTTDYSHTGLTPDTTLYYRVSAINAVGTGPASNVDHATTDPTIPGPPTNLTATADGRTRINLSWSPPADDGGSPVTGYHIEFSADGGTDWEDLSRNTGNVATSFVHAGLAPGTTRHYRVSAINVAGTGMSSNVDDATTDATVPGAPTGLDAMANGSSRIDLSWTAPTYDGGSPVTGYRIEISADAGVTWSDLVSNTGRAATSYAHTGLSAATTRHYRVRALNEKGAGAASNVDSATTASDVPDAPTGLNAVAAGTSRIDLSWSAPADDNGSAVTGYRIEVSNTGNSGWSVLDANTSSPTTTNYSHTGLTPDTTLYYRVSAINAVGTGPPSNVDHATTDPTIPGPPTNLTATADGRTRINLSWSPPADDGGSPVTGYHIEFSADGGTDWEDLSRNTGSVATFFVHAGLAPGTTRHYRVSAINVAGTGMSSNVDDATTDATVPGAPTGLDAMANGSSRIDLSWTAPTYDGGSPVTGYRIEVSADAGVTWSDLVSNTGRAATSYAHTGLSAATTRHYRVRALNEKGAGAASNVDSATTASDVPDAPTGLNAVAAGTSRIDLSWSAPADDNGSAVTGYRIEVSNTGNSGWSVLDANTSSPTTTNYSHTGLTPDTTLYYRVSAINAVGTGPPSNVDHATTDPTIPGPPTNLTATADGRTRINLSWSPPADDGGSPVTGYHIEFSADGGTDWEDLSRNTGSVATFFVHAGLAPGTTRHYRVSAINVAGTGMSSNVDDATTDATVPGAPTGLDAMANGSSRIDLSWTAPTYDGGSPVTGYRIEVSITRGLSWLPLEQNTGSTLTSYSHMLLPAATTRHYRVSARNVVGAGVASNVAHATTDPEVPGAPTDLTANARGTSRIELAWTAPSYTGGVPITGYQIEVSEDGGSQWEVHEANTSSPQAKYTHKDLDPASTRHYRVSAINVVGAGEASDVASATTDARAPDAPTDLAAAANGTSRIDLVWTAPAYDGGAAVTGYRIEVSVDRGLVWRNLDENTNSTDTYFADTGLSPATTRHYRVSAINRVGPGDPSNVEQATTDATVPNAPARLSATAKDHSQIDLDWAAPDFDGGSAVTGYRIEVSENEGSTWTNLVANTGSTTTAYSHTDLAPATTRHYRVLAINAIGTGNPSNMANATTDAIAPDPPTNLVATATAPTRIDLTWSAPAYDGGAPITSYRIEVSLDGINWTDLQGSTGVSLTSYAHIGLRPGSTRYYRVSAINVAGTGLPSGVASASTDDPVERAGRVNEAVLPHFAAAMTTSTLSAIAGRIESVASRNPLRSQLSASGLLSQAGNMGLRGSAGGLNMARLFDGKSFALPLGGDGQDQEGSTPAGFTTWGSAEYTSMGEPTGEEIEWEGDMLSIHVGADMRVHRDFLAGVAGTRSSGNYDFTDVTGEREVEGTYEARMTSLNPYVAWLPGRKGVSLWAAGSFGWGEVAVDDQPGGRRASDASLRTGAVGGSRIMLSSGASALRLRAEGWLSRVEVDGDEGMDSLTLEMQRLRLAVEWSQVHQLPGGQEVNFLLEGGLRYGDGDGTEGTGMEFGGGLRFVSATQALTVEGHGRLLASSPSDYEEWGIRGLIQIDPQAVNRGLSLKIVPAWGQSASGVQQLWEQGVSDRPDMSHARQRGRVNTRVEYGLGEFNGTPYGRFYLADGGARAFGTGMRYELTRVLDLRVEGTRTEGADGPARHGLAMRGRWVF